MGAEQSQWCGRTDGDYTDADTEIAEIANQTRSKQKELFHDALDEIQFFRKQYNDLLDSYEEMQDEYKKCKACNVKLQEAKDVKQHEMSSLTLEEENMKLNLINDDLHEKITKLTQTKNKYEHENRELQNELQQYKNEAKNSETKTRELKQQNMDLKRKLNAKYAQNKKNIHNVDILYDSDTIQSKNSFDNHNDAESNINPLDAYAKETNKGQKKDGYIRKLLSRERSAKKKASTGYDALGINETQALIQRAAVDQEHDMKQDRVEISVESDEEEMQTKFQEKILNHVNTRNKSNLYAYGRQQSLSKDSNESYEHQVTINAKQGMLMRLVNKTKPNTFNEINDGSDKSETLDGSEDAFFVKS